MCDKGWYDSFIWSEISTEIKDIVHRLLLNMENRLNVFKIIYLSI